MFLVAVSLPHYDHKCNKQFNGKLGWWDLTEEVTEQRSMKNRPKGTLLLKSIESINKNTIKEVIINNLLPSIVNNFTRDCDEVVIQVDKWSSHIENNDLDFRRAVSNINMNINIKKQPPKSPYLNVLDLGYFTSIQSFQQKENIRGIKNLVSAVKQSYESLEVSKLIRIFLMWQLVMLKVIEEKGDNTYIMPHKKKSFLEKECMLKTMVVIGDDLMERISQEHLFENQTTMYKYYPIRTRSRSSMDVNVSWCSL